MAQGAEGNAQDGNETPLHWAPLHIHAQGCLEGHKEMEYRKRV